MKRTLILTTAVALGLSLTAGAVLAREGGPRGDRPGFSELDRDGDGKVTMAEIEASATARFAATDTNGDGALSAEEMIAAAQNGQDDRLERRVSRMIERLDSDGDGSLSASEMAARGGDRMQKMFERIDADGDGALTEEEFAQMRERGGERGKGGHGGKGGQGGERGQGNKPPRAAD